LEQSSIPLCNCLESTQALLRLSDRCKAVLVLRSGGLIKKTPLLTVPEALYILEKRRWKNTFAGATNEPDHVARGMH
jgi:hypothetical protein